MTENPYGHVRWRAGRIRPWDDAYQSEIVSATIIALGFALRKPCPPRLELGQNLVRTVTPGTESRSDA